MAAVCCWYHAAANPAFLTLDPREDQGEFLLGRHIEPVEPQNRHRKPDIPGRQKGYELWRVGKARKPEKRHLRAPLAVP